MAQKYTILETDSENMQVIISLTVGKGANIRTHTVGVSARGAMSQEEILERCQHTADEAAANLLEQLVDESLMNLKELREQV